MVYSPPRSLSGRNVGQTYADTDKHDYLMMSIPLADADAKFKEHDIFDIVNVPQINWMLTTAKLANMVRGTLNTEFRADPSLIEWNLNGQNLDKSESTLNWMRKIHGLYVMHQQGCGVKCPNWYFGRQIYTCLSTAVGFEKSSSWSYWETWDDKMRTGEIARNHDSPEILVTHIKMCLTNWAQNLSK